MIIYTRKQENHCFFRLLYNVLPGTEKTTRLREKYPEIFIGIYNFSYLSSNVKLNARLFTCSEYNNFGFSYIYIKLPSVAIASEGI